MIPFRLRACATSRLLWTSLCAVALVGCGSNVKLDENAPPVESRSGTAVNPDGSGGASSGATSQSQVTPVDLTQGAGSDAANAAKRIVYFDFDSYVVRDDARPVIDFNAKALASKFRPKGDRLAIITNGGGPGAMAASSRSRRSRRRLR